jgi:hypothetical protein
MNVAKPALVGALVGSLIMSESRMISLPAPNQTPVQLVGGSGPPIGPDDAQHEAEAEDVDQINVPATTASVQPLMMFSETLKQKAEKRGPKSVLRATLPCQKSRCEHRSILLRHETSW